MAFFESTPLPAFENAAVVPVSDPPSVDRLGSIASILGLLVALVAYRRTVANERDITALEEQR